MALPEIVNFALKLPKVHHSTTHPRPSDIYLAPSVIKVFSRTNYILAMGKGAMEKELTVSLQHDSQLTSKPSPQNPNPSNIPHQSFHARRAQQNDHPFPSGHLLQRQVAGIALCRAAGPRLSCHRPNLILVRGYDLTGECGEQVPDCKPKFAHCRQCSSWLMDSPI